MVEPYRHCRSDREQGSQGVSGIQNKAISIATNLSLTSRLCCSQLLTKLRYVGLMT